MVGKDLSLLESRRLMLIRLGFEVHSFLGVQAYVETHVPGEVVMVVLCHTLTYQEQLCAAKVADITWPNAQLLALTKEAATSVIPIPTFDVEEGPLQFSTHIESLAQRWRVKYVC